MDHPADKDGIQVAEMSRNHDNGTLARQSSEMLDFSNDVYLVAERILIAKECSELLYPRSVEQAGEPELHDLAGKLVRTRLEIPCDLVRIPGDDAMQKFSGFCGYFFITGICVEA